METNNLAVLQSYKGPTYLCFNSNGEIPIAVESGVQEIKFWFGMSKTMISLGFAVPFLYAATPLLSVFTTMSVASSFINDRLSSSSSWISVFFDEFSGEMLSEIEVSCKEMAWKLAVKGDELFLNRKFQEAVKSYEAIPSDRTIFKIKLENAKNA